MPEYIEKNKALNCDFKVPAFGSKLSVARRAVQSYADAIAAIPAADVVEIPATGIGDLSDGYHTFNGLYYQRMILFAALVKQNKSKAWKSYRHEDGELCFGGGWFIVGIDTPEGSYTYHYENKDFDLFDCVEIPAGKHWDGHTEADVTRLLSLQAADAREVVRGKWEVGGMFDDIGRCSNCHYMFPLDTAMTEFHFCPNCGASMNCGASTKGEAE